MKPITVFLSLLLLTPGLHAQQRPRLDTTTMIVLGEGLAAGVSNFTLSEVVQSENFGAVVARQVNTMFPQPVFQPPGIGNAVGFPELPVSVPRPLQTTLRKQFPPTLFVFNLSVPGFRVADFLSTRPVTPLVHQQNSKQTLTNFILGFPSLILGKSEIPRWTPVEYAVNMRPTLVLVEIGYFDVLEAAVKGDPALLPDPIKFLNDYEQILKALRARHSEVIVMTVPNPFDTAYFTQIEPAARLLKALPFQLLGIYNLNLQDYVTAPGLVEIGNQFLGRQIKPLQKNHFVRASFAAEVTKAVGSINAQITSAASRNGARVYDLHRVFRDLRTSGLQAGPRKLTAEFLGGFYSLDGYYPGITGHAVIANGILDLLNTTYGTSFQKVSIPAVAQKDPVTDYLPAEGPSYTLEELEEFVPADLIERIVQLQAEPSGAPAGQSETPSNSGSTGRRTRNDQR